VLAGDLQLDLSTLGLSGEGSFSFKRAEDTQSGSAANLRYSIGGFYEEPSVQFDRQPLVQFLTQRALEREQERVEAMQASIMEKQRLRRQLDLLSSDAQERERLRAGRRSTSQGGSRSTRTGCTKRSRGTASPRWAAIRQLSSTGSRVDSR
jgi:hypothetical protein